MNKKLIKNINICEKKYYLIFIIFNTCYLLLAKISEFNSN